LDFQTGGNKKWTYDKCSSECNINQSTYPEGGGGYTINYQESCWCVFPNREIVRNKFNTKNKKNRK
jgi:hypothetical protein